MTADITPIMTPAQVAGRVAEIIRSRPGEWDQGSWFDGPADMDEGVYPVEGVLAGDCGTTCCVAGWAAVVSAPPGASVDAWTERLTLPDGSWRPVADAGAEALGMLPGMAARTAWLFRSNRTREEVLAELDRIAGGGDPRDR